MTICIKATGLAVLAAFTLGACATQDDYRADYETMSCLQLATELGRQQALHDVAKNDLSDAEVDAVLSDDVVDYAAAGIDGVTSEHRLKKARDREAALQEILARRTC